MAGRERWLEVAGRRVRYREAGGGGGVVVVVPGLGLSCDFYRAAYAALATAGLRVLVPDLPGFGKSAGPRLGLTVEQTARWLLAFADALGLGRAAWIGHSLGAQPAMQLAADHPARARALVLAAPTGAPARRRLLRQASGLVLDIGREPLALVPAVAREYLRTTPWAYLGTWLKAARHDPADTARRIRCPTLLVRGRGDPIVRPDFLELLRQRIPDAHVRAVPGGAHSLVFRRPEEFYALVVEFLRVHGRD